MRANYSLYDASALNQVEHAELPILYLHGGKDTFVPTSMAQELYENTHSEAEIHIFDEAEPRRGNRYV